MSEYWKFFTSASINKNKKMFEILWNEIVHLRTNYPTLSPALLVLIGLQVYYRVVVVNSSKLHCKQDSLYHKFLKGNLPILKEAYFPTFWCFESRMQTILASILRSTLPNINYRREVRIKTTIRSYKYDVYYTTVILLRIYHHILLTILRS